MCLRTVKPSGVWKWGGGGGGGVRLVLHRTVFVKATLCFHCIF